jgi:dihydrofolate reductase
MTEWIGPIGTGTGRAMLLGRRSYEGMLSSWNRKGGPFKDALNTALKYVASSSASTKLEWPNSTLFHGDIPAAVEQLKREGEGQLLIMGSAMLIHSLVPHNLIDEYQRPQKKPGRRGSKRELLIVMRTQIANVRYAPAHRPGVVSQ